MCDAPFLGHQAGDGAFGRSNPFPVQLPPDLAHAIDLIVRFPDALDLGTQLCISLSAIRPQRRVSQSCGMYAIGRWGDRQNPADRLDAINLTIPPLDEQAATRGVLILLKRVVACGGGGYAISLFLRAGPMIPALRLSLSR